MRGKTEVPAGYCCASLSPAHCGVARLQAIMDMDVGQPVMMIANLHPDADRAGNGELDPADLTALSVEVVTFVEVGALPVCRQPDD